MSNKIKAITLVLFLSIIILIVLYFISENTIIKVASLALTVAILLSIVLLTSQTTPSHQIRRKLVQAEALVSSGAVEELKKLYGEIYKLYLKLTEHHKQNFYARVRNLRERIEEQLQAGKRIEKMLQDVEIGSFAERQKKFSQLEEQYQQLPPKLQEQYFAPVSYLREKLERRNV